MDNKNLTERDREIISLVASDLGLSQEFNPAEPSKDLITRLVHRINKSKWDKYRFHEINVAVRSFFRAAAKINKDIYANIPTCLKSIFPNREPGDNFVEY